MLCTWRRSLLCAAASAAAVLIVPGLPYSPQLSYPALAEAQEGTAGNAPVDFSQSAGTDCRSSIPEGAPVAVFSPPEKPAPAPLSYVAHKQRLEGRSVISADPTPVLQPQTASCTLEAAERYRRIADSGGWPVLSGPLRRDASGESVKLLHERLSIEGDLSQDQAFETSWNETLTGALKSYQRRAGLQESGELDEATLKALNVPAGIRARELESSAARIANILIPFDQRYVAVNIPSASVEAVESQRAVQRHTAIAGKKDHPSPQLTATIRGITLNPSWTIPRSIVENELIPKLKRNPNYLKRAKLVVLDRNGRRVRRNRWSKAASTLTFRQEPGSKNPLGQLRIDMPNRDAVYMHDTPLRRQFAANYRFLSHGCVRVDGIYNLAAWLLNGANASTAWTPEQLRKAAREGSQRKIRLSSPVPVAWVYLDAWETADGVVHFAPDVYNLDGASE